MSFLLVTMRLPGNKRSLGPLFSYVLLLKVFQKKLLAYLYSLYIIEVGENIKMAQRYKYSARIRL